MDNTENITKVDDTTAQIESVQTIIETIDGLELVMLKAREQQRQADIYRVLAESNKQIAIMDEKLAKAASVGVVPDAPAPTQ